MKALAKARGPAFDHLFLTGMIQHHTGALVMVQDLFDTPGAGQDAVLFDFATDVDNTQRAEINIMQGMLKEKQMITERTSRFSRSAVTISLALAASYPLLCAGQTAHRSYVQSAGVIRRSARRTEGGIVRRGRGGLRTGADCLLAEAARLRPWRCSSLPDTRRRRRPPDDQATPAAASGGSVRLDQLRPGVQRQPSLRGQLQRHQFLRHRQSRRRSSCGLLFFAPAGQGDVSVYGHLLFMSAEAVNGRIDCGTNGIPLPAGYKPPPPPPPLPPAVDAEPGA